MSRENQTENIRRNDGLAHSRHAVGSFDSCVQGFFADRCQEVRTPIENGPSLHTYGDLHPSRVLQLIFHSTPPGASNNYPYFSTKLPNISDNDSFLSFADPTLAVDSSVSVGWYSGTADWDPRSAIDEMIAYGIEKSGAEEVWFIGESSGGFAALRHASQFPGSRVFVASPQTDATKFRGQAFPKLLEKCFRGSDIDTINAQFPGRFEVLSLYEADSPSWIYYVQNLTDPTHIVDQYLPFISDAGISGASGRSEDGHVISVLFPQKRRGHRTLTSEEVANHLSSAAQAFNTTSDNGSPGLAAEIDSINIRLDQLEESIAASADSNRRSFRSISRNLGSLPWSVEHYRRLAARLVPPDSPLPPAGSYAIRTPGIEELVTLVIDHQPRVILECGSGSSTVWMASQLELSQMDGHIYCLDHDLRFVRKTQDLLDRSGLAHRATIIHAPIEELSPAENLQAVPMWYSMDALASIPDNIDLIFVDGPPASVGRNVRSHALQALGDSLRMGGLIAVDDIARPDEAAMVREWLSLPQLQSRDGFSELAVLEKIAGDGGAHE